MYGAPPYTAYNNTKLENARDTPMPGLRSLTLSAGLCRERRKLVKPKTARSRRSLFVEVSQGRGGANEPSSSLFLCSSPPLSVRRPFPSFAFLCHSSFFSYQRVRLRFTYPFRPFHWNGEADRTVPLFVPFGSHDRLSSLLTVSSYSFPPRVVSFCLSPLLPVAMRFPIWNCFFRL